MPVMLWLPSSLGDLTRIHNLVWHIVCELLIEKFVPPNEDGIGEDHLMVHRMPVGKLQDEIGSVMTEVDILGIGCAEEVIDLLNCLCHLSDPTPAGEQRPK